MFEWKERRLLPKEGSEHIPVEYRNVCENCMLDIDCECCDISIPLVMTEWEVKEVTMRQNTLCGIPVGHPYEVGK